MSGIEHYQNEYENGRTRGILRKNPLANKLGMVEDHYKKKDTSVTFWVERNFFLSYL